MKDWRGTQFLNVSSHFQYEGELNDEPTMDSYPKKLLIMGLAGAGKTTLATALAPRLNAVHFNADAARGNINKDLQFSRDDRVEHARRKGWLCDRVVDAGTYAI